MSLDKTNEKLVASLPFLLNSSDSSLFFFSSFLLLLHARISRWMILKYLSHGISWRGKWRHVPPALLFLGRVSTKEDISHGIDNREIIMKVGMPIKIEILLMHKYLIYIHLYVIGSHVFIFFFSFLFFLFTFIKDFLVIMMVIYILIYNSGQNVSVPPTLPRSINRNWNSPWTMNCVDYLHVAMQCIQQTCAEIMNNGHLHCIFAVKFTFCFRRIYFMNTKHL